MLFSISEFVIVEFVMLENAALTVFRSDAFIVLCVMFDAVTAVLSMLDLLMFDDVNVELSMLVFCICPRVMVESVIVLFVIVVFSALVLLMSLSRMSLVFTVEFCMLLPTIRESVADPLSSVVWFTNESSVLLFEIVQLSIVLFWMEEFVIVHLLADVVFIALLLAVMLNRVESVMLLFSMTLELMVLSEIIPLVIVVLSIVLFCAWLFVMLEEVIVLVLIVLFVTFEL